MSTMRVLVLAPHTDDGEFGCGATIAKFVAEGHEVHYVAFSSAEKSVSPEFAPDVLRKEVVAATAVLGIPSRNLRVLDFEVRDFPACRQDILEVMVRLNADLQPDIVYLPATSDTHQDHQTISAEGFRAFKRTSLFGYELPWNNLTFTSSAFVVTEEAFIAKKIQALACYKSQADRSYATPEFIRSLARVRGTQIGVPYAEAFEAIRAVRRGTAGARIAPS
jgi:LmbE family N-acetylglucosaminyl deacetylase